MTSASGQNVFISYARDDVAFARDLRERLLAFGHEPWMDLFDIPAGARWPDEIDRALRSADVVVGVMTPSSLDSTNVKNEWDWVIANNRRLILLMAESCEVPFHYVSINYLDFRADQAHGFTALAKALDTPRPHQAPGPSKLSTGIDDGPLAAAKLRGLRYREKMLSAEGGTLSSQEVAGILGITRQAVDKRRKAGRLIGLSTGRRGYAYPAWQFDPESGTLPGLEEVLDDLSDHDPWIQLSFMLNPNAYLDDETPLEMLRIAKLEAVRRAAQAFGEQGAA